MNKEVITIDGINLPLCVTRTYILCELEYLIYYITYDKYSEDKQQLNLLDLRSLEM